MARRPTRSAPPKPRARRTVTPAEPAPAPSQLKPLSEAPADLQRQAGAYQALDHAAQLLNIGLFPGAAVSVLFPTRKFIEELRDGALADLKRNSAYADHFPTEGVQS